MLEDLRKSITEMSEEELREELRGLRSSRITKKDSGKKVAARSAAKGEPTKVAVGTLINALSPAEKAALLKELTGG